MSKLGSRLMDRRELILGAGAVAALGAASCATAQQGHEHHHGSGGGKHAGLVGSASHCVQTGEVCLAHCLASFKGGDTTLAECARLVTELNAACGALSTLAANDSRHLKAMAAVALGVCQDCEAECRKHEHHPECKACAESCAACAKECRAAA